MAGEQTAASVEVVATAAWVPPMASSPLQAFSIIIVVILFSIDLPLPSSLPLSSFSSPR